jgi:hypothetical protein
MSSLAMKLSALANKAFDMSVTPDPMNAFYNIRVERTGIAIEASWIGGRRYRHITSWSELDNNPDVLDYAFSLVENVVKRDRPGS